MTSATFSDPGSLADSNALGGNLSLQPRTSHVQMTEALQTSCACHSDGTGAVGTQVNVHVLSASLSQSLDVLRSTRGCCGGDVLGFT